MNGRTGANDPAFGQHLIDHGHHPANNMLPKPLNWDEIMGIMEQPGSVTQPDSYDAQYEAFYQAVLEVGHSREKRDIMKRIFPLIAGDSRICSSRNHSFSDLTDLTDGSIVKPIIEIYDGVEHDKLDGEIVKELRYFIKPLPAQKAPLVPNFFGVFKGAGALPEQIARYFGAIGARGIQKLRSFAMEDPEIVYDDKAYTITAIYENSTLRIYAHHPIQPPVRGGSEKYRMTLVKAIFIGDSQDELRHGVTAFRNAREWAMGKRDEFVEAANARRQTMARTQTNATAATQTTASAQNITTASAPDSLISRCISS